MHTAHRHRWGNIVGTLAFVVVALTAYGTWRTASPALAQQTCPSGQKYCASGTYSGQCRLETVTCPAGSLSASVDGCATCACPVGTNGRTKAVCNNTCVENSLGDPCAAANGEAGTKTGDACAPTCTENAPIPVVLTPTSAQVKSADRPAVNIVQGGAGTLLNLQAQAGGDGTTRKNVLTVDRTGIMLGWHPDPAKLGIDLGAAGGQNLIYGIAKAALEPMLDAFLLFQAVDGVGAITDRVRIRGNGDIVASGIVRSDEALCIRGECRDTWPVGDTTPDVDLQASTPGTVQSGNFSITGTGRMSVGRMATLELGERATPVLNARGPVVVGENLPFYVNSDGGIQFRMDANDDVDGIAEVAEFGVNNGANQRVFEVFESGIFNVYAPGSVTSAFRFSPAPAPGWSMLTLTAPISDPSWSGRIVELGSPEGTMFSVASDGTMGTRRGFFRGYPFDVGALSEPILLVSGMGGTHFSVDADGDIVGRGTMTMNGPITGHGRATLDGAPLDAAVLGGSLVLNPSTSAFDATLLGIAKNGAQLFRFDTDGDLQIARDATVIRDLDVNGTSFIGRERIAKSCLGVLECTAACSAGKVVIGGGCLTTRPLDGSYPLSETQWTCHVNGTTTAAITAHAVCARVAN